MAVNSYMGQLVGPFKGGEELFNKIKETFPDGGAYVQHIGIQMYPHTAPTPGEGVMVYLNGMPVEIGNTKIYEIGNINITSIYFSADVDEYTIIDYAIGYEE